MSPVGASSQELLAAGQWLAGPLPALLVAADRVAATVWQGVHGRRRVGQGDAFWQFRPYQPGDTPQRIDWKQSAKSDQVYVRQAEWEAVQTVWLWRDASASMAYRSRRGLPTKRERADLLTMALASLLARAGEHFGLLGQTANDAVPPASGRPALLRLASALATAQAQAPSLPAATTALSRYARAAFFGDWWVPPAQVQALVSRLAAAGIRGHLIQVVDPAEEVLPFSGRVLFEGCEGEGRVMLRRVESLRDDYRRRLAAHRDSLQAIVAAFGWTLLLHRTDQPATQVLLALYAALADPRDF